MIATISNQERGASVRAKLNEAIGKINASDAGSSAETGAPATFADIAEGLSYAFTWTPSAATSVAVVAAEFSTHVVDTTNGDISGTAHFVGRMLHFTATGGGTLGQAFLDEIRCGVTGATTIGTLGLKKWVLEADADVSGTLATLVLEDMADHSATAGWVTTIRRNFLDPRTVTTHAGGVVQTPKVVAGDYTLLESDSGRCIMLFDTVDRTITAPDTLPDGFKVEILQGNTGAAIFATGGGRVLFEPGSLNKTQGAFKLGRLTLYTSTVAALELT